MSDEHTEKGAADVVVEQHEYARDLVSDKFQEARDYTDQSWELLQDSVDELKNAVNSFDDEEIEIEEPSVDTEDITADVDADTKTIEFRDVMNKIDELNGLPSVPSVPSMDTLQDFPIVRTNLADQLMDDYITKMLTKLEEEGTGLGADVEADIWQRALDRQELQVQQLFEQSENYFAARGFTLPPGALSGKLNEINVETGRRYDQMNMDIAIEQARLAQTNTHFILEQVRQFALQETLQEIQMIVAANDTKIRKYAAEVQAFGQVMSAIIGAVDEGIKLLGTYIEKYKAQIQLASVEIDGLYKAATIKIEVAKLKLAQAMKIAELQVEENKAIYAAKVEAAKALASVSGQGMAAALTSIHASASVGASGAASYTSGYNRSDTYDKTKETAYGPQFSTTHQYYHSGN